MKTYFLLFFSMLLVASCSNNRDNKQHTLAQKDSLKKVANAAIQIKRFGMVTGIKKDKIEYYNKLHAAVWPRVLQNIRECNIQNYSIYLQKIGDKYYLFSYFEYTGKDIDADWKKLAADSTTQRWWKETDPTQNPLPAAAAKNEIWTSMEEVFHAN